MDPYAERTESVATYKNRLKKSRETHDGIEYGKAFATATKSELRPHVHAFLRHKSMANLNTLKFKPIRDHFVEKGVANHNVRRRESNIVEIFQHYVRQKKAAAAQKAAEKAEANARQAEKEKARANKAAKAAANAAALLKAEAYEKRRIFAKRELHVMNFEKRKTIRDMTKTAKTAKTKMQVVDFIPHSRSKGLQK